MMRMVSAIVFVALVGGIASAQSRSGLVVSITDRDEGQHIEAPVGSELRVRLSQPADPRIRWELRDDRHLSLITPPDTNNLYRPARGDYLQVRDFRIRVVEPGSFMLIFALRSPSRGLDQGPERRFVMTVHAPSSFRPPRPAVLDGPDTVEPITERDAGDVIDVPAGRKLIIALPSNRSTGFYWGSWQQKNVRVYDDEVREQRGPDARTGAGGTSLIPFRVLRRGPGEVTLMYLPPGGGRSRKTLTYRFRGV